jgi:hypothetical protein
LPLPRFHARGHHCRRRDPARDPVFDVGRMKWVFSRESRPPPPPRLFLTDEQRTKMMFDLMHFGMPSECWLPLAYLPNDDIQVMDSITSLMRTLVEWQDALAKSTDPDEIAKIARSIRGYRYICSLHAQILKDRGAFPPGWEITKVELPWE